MDSSFFSDARSNRLSPLPCPAPDNCVWRFDLEEWPISGPLNALAAGRPRTGAAYAPLSTAATTTGKRSILPATFAAIGKLRQIPLGALLGLAVAGAFRFVRPDLSPGGWMEAPFALFCAACGILLERTGHYAFGWYVDARLKHLAARYEARVELAKLRDYEKQGVLSQADVRRIAARIARRDVAGGPRPQGRPRGPYKKKTAAIEPVPDGPSRL